MKEYVGKNWKIRISKTYSNAKNHIVVGKIVNCNEVFVALTSKTFHFGNAVNDIKDIQEGRFDIRIIPWSRIEIIHELPDDFMLKRAKLQKVDTGIIFHDGEADCQIARSLDKRY